MNGETLVYVKVSYCHATHMEEFRLEMTHLRLLMTDLTENQQRIARDVMLSASIIAKEIQSIHPVAPVLASLISPGAHPLLFAIGPNMPNPA